MEKAGSYIEVGQKINKELEVNDVIEVQAGNKLIVFGRKQQFEAHKKLFEILGERDKIEIQLFKISKSKKYKPLMEMFQ